MLASVGVDPQRDHDRVLLGLDPVLEQRQELELGEISKSSASLRLVRVTKRRKIDDLEAPFASNSPMGSRPAR